MWVTVSTWKIHLSGSFFRKSMLYPKKYFPPNAQRKHFGFFIGKC